jgi:hypothetical protein
VLLLVLFLELLLHQIRKENLLLLILDYMLHLRHLRRIVLDFHQCLLLYLLLLRLRRLLVLKKMFQLHLDLRRQMLRNFLDLLRRRYYLVGHLMLLVPLEYFQDLRIVDVLHLLQNPQHLNLELQLVLVHVHL